MINVVMLVKDRPRLTLQALSTLARHTDVEYNLTIVDDASKPETRDMLSLFGLRGNVAVIRNETSKGITGQARNLGVYWAETYWGRGDWLYLSDNDVAFLPAWSSKMIAVTRTISSDDLIVLGGACHPYHQPNYDHGEWVETDAVAGYSQLMSWEAWDNWGPLDAHAAGTGQSEDHKFCREVVRDGHYVGYMKEPVLIDCGITGTDGKPATGHESKPIIRGVYYE